MIDERSDRDPNGGETDGAGSGGGADAVDRADIHGAGPRVEREVRIPAEPGRIWEAWADPELIAGWFVERAVDRVEEGGRVTWAWDRFGVEVEQEVLVADSPRRLVLRMPARSQASDGEGAGDRAHVLEVTIEADGDESVVRVVESGFGAADASEIEGNDAGWALALAVLRHYVLNAYGRSRAELMALRPAPGGCGPARSLFRTAEGLGRWL
ncbi:MAG: SRPBCC family protein, partial [Gemmatimonadota bacterium]